MNTAELSARIDALSAEIGRVDGQFESVGKRLLALQEEIDRICKNTNIDIYELRQRIRALETGTGR